MIPATLALTGLTLLVVAIPGVLDNAFSPWDLAMGIFGAVLLYAAGRIALSDLADRIE